MKCHECGKEMSCEPKTVHLTDKDGLSFDETLAHFTCNDQKCCEYNKPTLMDKYTKQSLQAVNEHNYKRAIKKCEE